MSRRPVVGRLTCGVAAALVAVSSPAIVPDTNTAVAAQTERTLVVAAATDLRFALEDIVPGFQMAQHARVQLIFGSSGQLATQIEQGAPYDLFFSADEAFVTALARKGLVDRNTVQLYAIGRIALWVRKDTGINLTDGLAALLDPRVRFVAIANPEHAPYGRAAIAALRAADLLNRVQAKLVVGESVTQAFQFVQTGNADAGIVALSLALAPANRDTGRYWLIPASLHPPIRQAVALVSGSSRRDIATAFVALVTGPQGRSVLRRYGFTLPGETL